MAKPVIKRATRAIAVIAVSTIIGCGNQIAPTTPPIADVVTLRLHTTNTTHDLIQHVTEQYHNRNANVNFSLSSSNHDAALSLLSAGDVPYLITQALPSSSTYWAAPIAQDGITVITHPQNPVNNLSTEQLRRIYRGFITNWQDVGGTAQPITLYTREASSGLRQEFERTVMGQQRIAATSQILPSTMAILQRVTQQSSAIGYVPAHTLTENRLRAVAIDGISPSRAALEANRYPLRYTIYMVGTQAPQNAFREFLGWLQSIEGQAIIKQVAIPLPT